MTLKYESEILFDLMKRDGDDTPSDVLPYESELKEKYLEQVEGAYPKLQDYRSEWLNYNLTAQIPANFPIETLSNVTEATVKNVVPYAYRSAILKGNTLVNLAGWNNIKNLDYMLISNNMATINFESYYASATIKTTNMIKQNTTYTLITESKVTKSEVDGYSNPPRQNGMTIQFTDGTVQTPMTSFQNVGERVLQKVVFTVENKEIKQIYMRFFTSSLATSGVCQGEVYSVMLIEGDYTNTDIPYFEGMQSVKMPVLTTTGKNLFDSNNTMDGYGFSEAEVIDKDTWFISNYIEVKPNLSYIISASDDSVIGKRINFYDKNKNFVENGVSVNLIISVPNNNKIFYMRTNAYLSIKSSYQIEQGTVATPYEPYKSNILSCLEPVELGSVGEVEDELNLLTHQLTQRTETRPYQEGDELNSEFVTDMTNTRYKLAQEVVKTVDLTVTDHDGNTKSIIRPIEGAMHLSTSGKPIKPTFSGEIPVEAITQNLASFNEE